MTRSVTCFWITKLCLDFHLYGWLISLLYNYAEWEWRTRKETNEGLSIYMFAFNWMFSLAHSVLWQWFFIIILQILYCNIGNPQSLGQQPITFFREVSLQQPHKGMQRILYFTEPILTHTYFFLRFLHYVTILLFWTKRKYRVCSGIWFSWFGLLNFSICLFPFQYSRQHIVLLFA